MCNINDAAPHKWASTSPHLCPLTHLLTAPETWNNQLGHACRPPKLAHTICTFLIINPAYFPSVFFLEKRLNVQLGFGLLACLASFRAEYAKPCVPSAKVLRTHIETCKLSWTCYLSIPRYTSSCIFLFSETPVGSALCSSPWKVCTVSSAHTVDFFFLFLPAMIELVVESKVIENMLVLGFECQ